MSEKKQKRGRNSRQAERPRNPGFGSWACPDCTVAQSAMQLAKGKGQTFSLDDWQCPHAKRFEKTTEFLSPEEMEQLLKKNGKSFVSLGIPVLDDRLRGGVRRSRLTTICCDADRLGNAFRIVCGLAELSKVLYCVTTDDPLDYGAMLDKKRPPIKPVVQHIRCIKQIPALLDETKADVVLLSPILAMPYDLITLWSLALHYNVAVVGVLDEAELACYEEGVSNLMRFSDTVLELKSNIIGGMNVNVLKEAD